MLWYDSTVLHCIAEYTVMSITCMFNALVQQDIWICFSPIPNTCLETIPISLSYPLCLILFTFILYTQHKTSSSR